MRAKATVVAIMLLAASRALAGGEPGQRDCRPLETRPANTPAQQPAFAEQTRACKAESNTAFDVVVVTAELEYPWAVEPLPDGGLLVTEKPGRMRIVAADGELGEPLRGVPRVDARGQGGLLDVALSPTFASDRMIFWSYSEPRGGGNATSVARGVLSKDRLRLDDVKVIFRAERRTTATCISVRVLRSMPTACCS